MYSSKMSFLPKPKIHVQTAEPNVQPFTIVLHRRDLVANEVSEIYDTPRWAELSCIFASERYQLTGVWWNSGAKDRKKIN